MQPLSVIVGHKQEGASAHGADPALGASRPGPAVTLSAVAEAQATELTARMFGVAPTTAAALAKREVRQAAPAAEARP